MFWRLCPLSERVFLCGNVQLSEFEKLNADNHLNSLKKFYFRDRPLDRPLRGRRCDGVYLNHKKHVLVFNHCNKAFPNIAIIKIKLG